MWVETKTDGEPRLRIARSGPTQAEQGSCCEFTVTHDPSAKRSSTHYNPEMGLDDGEGVASTKKERMSQDAEDVSAALRKKLQTSRRSTLVSFTNLSSHRLVLEPREKKCSGGSWAREPPAVIEPQQLVSFGSTCSLISPTDLVMRLAYHTEPSASSARGVDIGQQAGFRLKCVNPTMDGEKRFRKYLTGDDGVGLAVAKQTDAHLEQQPNNEWSFLITGELSSTTRLAIRQPHAAFRRWQ